MCIAVFYFVESVQKYASAEANLHLTIGFTIGRKDGKPLVIFQRVAVNIRLTEVAAKVIFYLIRV